MTLIVSKGLRLSRIQQYPAIIGEPFGGGFFAGYISHTANGSPTHALIAAPAAIGATGGGYPVTTNLLWKTVDLATEGAFSSFDGVANTAAMVAAGIANHPAAQFCVNLNIGGFTDWYLPARFELEIAHFNFKPGTDSNVTSVGSNIYAVPQRLSNYTAGNPSQTTITAFQAGQPEVFTFSSGVQQAAHWSSTGASTTTAFAFAFRFDNGGVPAQGGAGNARRVRAFRRIVL